MRCAFIIVGHYRKLGDSRVVDSIVKFQNQYPSIVFDNHLYVSFDDNDGKLFHHNISKNDLTFDEVKEKMKFCSIHTFKYVNNRSEKQKYDLDSHYVLINDKKYDFTIEKQNLTWSLRTDQRGKICNQLFPQFFCMKKAYEFVKKYETENDINYDIYIRSRTDLVFNNFHVDLTQLNTENSCVFVPTFTPGDHGIADHIAFCNKSASDIYFNAESSFRDPSKLICREQCIVLRKYRENNKKIPNALYDNTHNILNDHLLSNNCKIIILNSTITATPSSADLYILR